MAKDERRMTFIVVPHGGEDLSTRSFEISYRRLRVAGGLLVLAVLIWLGMAVSWGYFAGQAARVPVLSRRIEQLKGEQARMEQLAEALRQLEARYNQVRGMLGADRPEDTTSIWLPPVGTDAVEQPPADSAVATLPSAWPLTKRGFITREHLGRIPGQHPGIDIAVAEGSYIRAAGAGTVVRAGEDDVYGKFVRIHHPGGYETVYGHASELFVEAGDPVERHEVIALSGNTGTSTAPHLHFEVWKDNEPIDPREIVQPPN